MVNSQTFLEAPNEIFPKSALDFLLEVAHVFEINNMFFRTLILSSAILNSRWLVG